MIRRNSIRGLVYNEYKWTVQTLLNLRLLNYSGKQNIHILA